MKTGPMKVLLLNQVFWPDVAATAQHGHDLGRYLAERGERVTALASRSLYGEAGGALPRGVAVEAQDRRGGQPPQFLDLLLCHLGISRPDVLFGLVAVVLELLPKALEDDIEVVSDAPENSHIDILLKRESAASSDSLLIRDVGFFF